MEEKEIDIMLEEIKKELYFEIKVLTRDQCYGSLTRHNILYERAKEILDNWHEIKIDKF